MTLKRLQLVFVLALMMYDGYSYGQSPLADPCSISLTLFPEDTVNEPEAWTKAAQVAAGNIRDDLLFTTALTGGPHPKLHFAPQTFLVKSANSTVPAECTDAISTRRLKASGILTQPADWTATYSFADGPTQTLQTVNGSWAVVELAGLDTALYDDGWYCLEVQATVLANSALITWGDTSYTAPPEDVALTTKVCFMKIALRPQAVLQPNSCAGQLTLNLTKIFPMPVPIHPEGEPLYWPVVRVVGVWNASKPGVEEENNMMMGVMGGEDLGYGEIEQFEQWAVRKSSNDTNWVILQFNDRIREGYYTVTADISLATKFPSLMSLPGSSEYKEENTPVEAMFRFVSKALDASGSRFLVNYNPTVLQDPQGPLVNGGLELGGKLTFNWEYNGEGNMTCEVDGRRIFNSVNYTCVPPISFNLESPENSSFLITFNDICGNVLQKKVDYGIWGWSLDRSVERDPPVVEAHDVEGTEDYVMPPSYFRQRSSTVNGSRRASRDTYGLLSLLVALGLCLRLWS